MSAHGPLGVTDGGTFELSVRAGARERAVPRSRRELAGIAGLCGLLITGLLITISAAGTDALLPESVRPIPKWLAGPFGASGIDLGPIGAVAVLAAMFASYVLATRAADTLSPRAVLMCIAALHALVLLAPPLLSTDVFSYQAYARMGDLYGANPYLQGPHAIALDPLYPFIGAKWVTTPSTYGPVFTGLGYLLVPLSIAASTLAYKAIAAIASLVTVALVWNVARLRGLDSVKAAALVGLNPLVVVYGVGGGHNDLLMLAALLAGISLLLQNRARGAGGLIAIAAGVKLTAGFFAPFAIAGSGGPLSRTRRRELVLGIAIGCSFVLALGFAVFGKGQLHLLGTVQQTQSEGDWHSIPGFISTRLGLGGLGHVVLLVLAFTFTVIFFWLLRRVWRGQLDWIDAAAWAAVALLVTAGSLLPWYVAWLLPLAALGYDRRLWKAAMWMTGVVLGIQLLGYIPHAIATVGL